MAPDAIEDWPSEHIPDHDVLYMRVHRSYIRNGQLTPGVFRDQGDAMSVNWQRYCETPEAARQLAKIPAENGVVQLIAGEVRAVPLAVVHTPDRESGVRSHADVRGAKTTEVRAKLMMRFRWCLWPLTNQGQVV